MRGPQQQIAGLCLCVRLSLASFAPLPHLPNQTCTAAACKGPSASERSTWLVEELIEHVLGLKLAAHNSLALQT